MNNNGKKVTRNEFFRNYFLDLFGVVDEAFGDKLSDFAEKFPELIRPPGACSEKEFIEKCSRCGACVKACPFFALTPVLLANEFDRGTPALRVGQSYCRFCENFPCVNACKSGALNLLNSASLQKIATARIVKANCLRSAGTDCSACSKKCELLGDAAISITADSTTPVIDPEKCSGCGACITVCPAYPDPAIKIEAK